MNRRSILYTILSVWYLLFANTTFAYTRQDTLRGSNGNGRYWWDVAYYDLEVKFDTVNKAIAGMNTITLDIPVAVGDSLQLDLQEPMVMDSVLYNGRKLNIVREGNVYWLTGLRDQWTRGIQKITACYHGRPRVAKNAPWEGGFVWSRDGNGKLWLAVACQGYGASSWWPCKDIQNDEPDNGMMLTYEVPDGLQCVANGRLIASTPLMNGYTSWKWQVRNPINTYNATFYIGDYVSWHDTLKGEGGNLDMHYCVLRENEAKAKKHFQEAKPMIQCFEYWMGAYPFYNDGYKLVEAPYLGMEHQSAIAYGNKYQKGYMGTDRSGSGVGNEFDYIIVHESGHEWFGNNITASDIADNWIQEGFTTYTETLYAQWISGKEKAYKFVRGEWKNIRNDKLVIGNYSVNDDGSSDKYDKGAAVVHMIRMMMGNDAKFRDLLRGLNKEFRHRTVSTAQVEAYIMKQTGLALQPFFDQYLRTTDIPVFEWYIKNKKLHYRFTSVTKGFSLPLEVSKRKRKALLTVTDEWQSTDWKRGGYNISLSEDFLIRTKD